MRRFIRLGDKTSHGGTVVSANSRMIVGGIPVACVGDRCTCPKKGHNNCVIVEGDSIISVDGRAVALEGCKCSCGAVLISSMPNAGRVYEGGDSAWRGSQVSSNTNGVVTMAPATSSGNSIFDYDEHFILVNHRTGDPLEGWHYRVHALGETSEGVTGDDGKTGLVGSNTPDRVVLDCGHQTEIGV